MAGIYASKGFSGVPHSMLKETVQKFGIIYDH